jgi:photosystem II stability/assembly factor-like uncharacterized protein
MPRPGRYRCVGGAGALLVAVLTASPVAGTVLRDNLYGVEAVSASEAWAVGNFGAVYYTRDAGRTWEARESGTKMPLFAIDFADATHGWAVGKSALVLATADGGRSWKRQQTPIPPDKHLFALQAVDAKTVWAVGDWGAITLTRDGGETWEDRSLGTIPVREEAAPERTGTPLTDDVILYAVAFPGPDHGYIAGEFGTVLATTDGGRTWTKQAVGTQKTLFGIGFASAERGWAVGIDGLIVRTRDGGRHWEVQRGEVEHEALEDVGFLETIKNPGLYDVDVRGQHGVVVGDTGVLLTTADGGETWQRHELPESQRLVWMRGVSLASPNGFVVGANGFAARVEGERVLPANGRDAPP